MDTMLFNGDPHVLPDDARVHGYLVPGVDVLGAVGAWVASESRPEQLVVRAYVDGESEDELSIRIPGREWLDVVQINPDQTRIVSPIGECDLKRSGVDDVDGDEIDDLTVVFQTGCLAKGHRGLLVGFFDERFGGAAFRGCDDFSAAPVRVSAEDEAPGAVD